MTKKQPPQEPAVLEGQISLEEYLEQLDGPNPEAGDEFTADDAMASRLLRELGTLEKTMEANSQLAEAERAKISLWESTVNEPLSNRVAWLRGQLEQYGLHERAASERKTISLPFGTIKTYPKAAQWNIGPEFIEWAKSANPTLLRTKYEPEKDLIKATFETDSENRAVDPDLGTVIPGITVTPATVTAKVDAVR